jgi:hypothetical protein
VWSFPHSSAYDTARSAAVSDFKAHTRGMLHVDTLQLLRTCDISLAQIFFQVRRPYDFLKVDQSNKDKAGQTKILRASLKEINENTD